MISGEAWLAATMTSDHQAALSEGFCLPCKARLGDPIYGKDGGPSKAVTVIAAQCPTCKAIYLW